jgi:L-aspartate oxidase
MGKIPVIRTIVEQGRELIQYLIDIGTNFTLENQSVDRKIENLSLTKEGGHSQKRVAYAADSTGHEIMKALISACVKEPNIEIFEEHMAVDLITQHHIPQKDGFITRLTCWGAYVLNIKTNQIQVFQARKTMLATGGGAQVYANNTNPDIATGDGYAIVKLAGARIANMEFIQFHPTAFYDSEGKSFLITEALRGEGAILTLQDGSTFMEQYHPKGSLAPRDVVARAIDYEMKKRNLKWLYLDATALSKDKILTHFPYIYKKCKERGIDITVQPIPIVPAAHYFCGGVVTTIDGRTDIANLFAAGEVACTGLHGANRLASNSLLEGLVIAYRAGQHPSNKNEVDFPTIPQWQENWKNIGAFNENEWVVISHNREIIRRIMQGYVGITRSRRLLKYAESRIRNMYMEINNFYQHNPVKKEVIECRNMAIVAGLIIQSALLRKESRGLHYVTDYPEQDDKNYQKDTII